VDVLKVLRKEESKLLTAQNKIAGRLAGLRGAINALSTNGHKPFDGHTPLHKVSKLRGKKLSAAHRAAIKRGIAKARAGKA